MAHRYTSSNNHNYRRRGENGGRNPSHRYNYQTAPGSSSASAASAHVAATAVPPPVVTGNSVLDAYNMRTWKARQEGKAVDPRSRTFNEIINCTKLMVLA